MVKTLRESKAKLSELVERASHGEDVLISVRGKIKARLTRATAPGTKADNATWLRELAELRKAESTGKRNISVDEIIDEIREDRV